MALKPFDAKAYLLVRTYITAGAAAWDKWAADGGVPLQGPAFPLLDPSAKYLSDQIFEYIPRMTIVLDADPDADNCPTEEQRVDGACFVMRHDVVFNPANRQRMLNALNERTPPEILATVEQAEAANPKADDESTLEWWVMLVLSLAQGAFYVALGGGSAVIGLLAIVEFIFASYAALNIIFIKTNQGHGIFEKWASRLGEGFKAVVGGAASIGRLVIGVGVVALLWSFFGRR